MKVIIDNDGVSAHIVNDKAEISHEIAQKTTLSKRSDGVISNKNERTVGGGEKSVDVDNSPRGSPTAASRKAEHFTQRPRSLASGNHKVLQNGVVGKDELTKKKARVISSKRAAKLKKAKLKKLKKQQVKVSKEQSQLIGFAMGGYAVAKSPHTSKAAVNARKAVHIAKKPVDVLKREFYSRADKSDDNGIKAAKTGVKIGEQTVNGVKTAVNTGVKTAENGAKITKRVYKKLHKPTSAELRRKLRKQITRQNLGAQARYLAKRTAENTAKAAAKATEKAAVKSAQAAAKASQAAARAVANAATRIVGFIIETMPYSIVIIAGAALILVFSLMFGSMMSSAGGTVAGGGAWVVDDNSDQTPEEIYDGYNEYIEQAQDVIQKQAKDALKSEVSGYCGNDTSDPRKIIQYIDKNTNRTFYPASGAASTINSYIEQFGSDDYADYMSLLFVLMTREKQQAEGVSDDEIYDFDFTRADFEEFIKSVNTNSCRWGDTFIYKTAVTTSPHACPGRNCKTEYREGCKCSSYTDSDGVRHEYCGGHSYCPVNHPKLTVTLYTIKDYYGKDYPEIYNFTENEMARYEASKEMIQGMLEYWEEEND